jgi:hypothetical protein
MSVFHGISPSTEEESNSPDSTRIQIRFPGRGKLMHMANARLESLKNRTRLVKFLPILKAVIQSMHPSHLMYQNFYVS